MTDPNKILIGKIIAAHGIKGEVKLISFTHGQKGLNHYSSLFDKEDQMFPRIKLISFLKATSEGEIFIARIEGVENRQHAEALRGCALYINRQEFPELPEDEFYYVDLLGISVKNETGEVIGKVVDVNDFGAGGMIEVEFNADLDRKNQIFPFRNNIIAEVNIKQGYLLLKEPEII